MRLCGGKSRRVRGARRCFRMGRNRRSRIHDVQRHHSRTRRWRQTDGNGFSERSAEEVSESEARTEQGQDQVRRTRRRCACRSRACAYHDHEHETQTSRRLITPAAKRGASTRRIECLSKHKKRQGVRGVCRMQCCSVRGHYRPNRAPNPENAVGSRVRPARQSRDCLQGRPLRTPAFSAMVRSALGSVLPTHARARWRHFVASPLRQSRFFRRKLAHPLASVRSMV